MSDEEDYMSAEVLAACTDIATGEKKSKKATHKPPTASNLISKRARREQLTSLMDSTRETAQQTPLDATNKGFQMLQKLGYTSGGLGKDSRGMEEPLAVDKRDKNDVTGVGLTSLVRQQQQKLFHAKRKQQQVAEQWLVDFHSTQRTKHALRDIKRDIRAAERVIYNLDVRYELVEHELWPEEYQTHEEETKSSVNSSDDEDILAAKMPKVQEVKPTTAISLDTAIDLLATRLEYLRNVHCYCLYCGVNYEDAAELGRECPGLSREAH